MCGIIVLSVIAVIVGFILIFIIEYWEFLLAFLILTVVIAIIAVKYEAENGTGEKRELPQKSYEPENDSVNKGLAAAILLGMLLSDETETKRHKGHCDGDCRNCHPITDTAMAAGITEDVISTVVTWVATVATAHTINIDSI